MKEIAAQLINGVFYPYSDEDVEALSDFHNNQICRLNVYGVQKERSYLQLKMFFGLCKRVAENTENQHWNTKEKVAFQVKVALQFTDPAKLIVDSKGNVHVHYRSISFKNLNHMKACKFFDRAWPVMAKHLGITEDELLANANES
jgi:hypothetical protein